MVYFPRLIGFHYPGIYIINNLQKNPYWLIGKLTKKKTGSEPAPFNIAKKLSPLPRGIK